MSSTVVSSGNFWTTFFVNNRVVSGVIIIALYLAILSFFGYLIAPYIKKIYTGENTKLRKYTDPIIGTIEKLAGVDRNETYSFKGYFISLIIFNFVAGAVTFFFLIFQGYFFRAPGQSVMSPSLAFNTIVSFLTNTNLQHYSSPSVLTYVDLSIVIIGLMFISAGTGFAASMAFVRGIMNDDKKLGNFFHDFLVAIFDLILPLSLIATVLLIIVGVPDVTYSNIIIHPFFGRLTVNIPVGPVASLEGIKNIGTNGGGFYGTNAGYPFENPNWISNLIEVVSFTIIPIGSIFALGQALNNRKFGMMIYGVIMALFVFSALMTFFGEIAGIPAMANLGFNYGGNFIGKETAIGISQSSIFASGATLTSTGAANSALIDYTPAGILGVLFPLLLNDPLGGVGTGVLNIFTYVIFTVFLISLMVGKLPEIMSLKVSSKEIKYSTYSLITHPLIIIIPLGVVVLLSPILMSSFINTKPDQITQLLYEFASAASNNGSEMGGFTTNSAFFNIMDGIIILLGRYPIIGFQLVIAQSFATKKPKVMYGRTFDIGSFWFGLMLFFTMILLGLLSFFPILAVGPLLAWGKSFSLLIGGGLL
ncbi:MAG: potassium-transporting ATPase subunit KdpA [Cuniculiplasma sp.]